MAFPNLNVVFFISITIYFKGYFFEFGRPKRNGVPQNTVISFLVWLGQKHKVKIDPPHLQSITRLYENQVVLFHVAVKYVTHKIYCGRASNNLQHECHHVPRRGVRSRNWLEEILHSSLHNQNTIWLFPSWWTFRFNEINMKKPIYEGYSLFLESL